MNRYPTWAGRAAATVFGLVTALPGYLACYVGRVNLRATRRAQRRGRHVRRREGP